MVALRKKVHKGDLDCYSSETSSWEEILGEGCLRETSIQFEGAELAREIVIPNALARSIGTDPDDGEDAKGDIANAKLVFQSLQHLTPQQAADERVWLYLTHCPLWAYSRARWPIPTDAQGRRKIVRLHYTPVNNNRSWFRDNAVSRLWWMGYVANRSNLGLEDTLQILLFKSDVRANLLDRPGLGTSEEIFNGVIQMLLESYDGDRGLFERNAFRKCMKGLNRIGGRRMLNALGQVSVYRFGKDT